jgi:hypothetical protein
VPTRSDDTVPAAIDDATEELVRAALNRQATRAPHPAAVRTALHAGRPARTRTPLVLAAAALAVLAAVGVPLGLHLTARPAAPPAAPTPAPVSTTAAPPPGTSMRYAPSFLPPGVVEEMRAAASDGTVSRTWQAPGSPAGGPVPSVRLLVTGPTGAYADVVQQIAQVPHRTVHGVTAGVFADDDAEQRSRLVWLPEPGTVINLTVTGMPNSMDLVQRIADSISPDSAHTVATPLLVAPLPGLPDTSLTVHGDSPRTWVADWNAQNNADTSKNPGAITVSYGPGVAAPPTSGGSPVRVDGQPGEYFPVPAGHQEVPGTAMVAVKLNGYWLEVSSLQPGQSALLRAAGAVRVHAVPTPSWLGTR